MSSGSTKRQRASKRRTEPAPAKVRRVRTDGAPPELSAWQVRVLDVVARSKLASEVVFGGGAALATRHLHHRRSEDLDFFLNRELEDGELRPVTRSLVSEGIQINEQQVGPRRTLLLLRGQKELGRVDFSSTDPIQEASTRVIRGRGGALDRDLADARQARRHRRLIAQV